MACEQVLVLDAHFLIDTKSKIPPRDQWWFFDRLIRSLQHGRVVVPLMVMKELQQQHPDMPGAWAAGTYQLSAHVNDPDYERVQEVMESAAGAVIDVDAETDDADPWVLALAIQLRASGFDVLVVTGDMVDRPSKMSLMSACAVFGINCIQFEEAIDWLEDHNPDATGPHPAFAASP